MYTSLKIETVKEERRGMIHHQIQTRLYHHMDAQKILSRIPRAKMEHHQCC